MTIGQIRAYHTRNFPESKFFAELSRKKESLDTMRVLKNTCIVETEKGRFACYQVCSAIAGTVPKKNIYHYFEIMTFELIATKI